MRVYANLPVATRDVRLISVGAAGILLMNTAEQPLHGLQHDSQDPALRKKIRSSWHLGPAVAAGRDQYRAK
jgi:hypothetical protein